MTYDWPACVFETSLEMCREFCGKPDFTSSYVNSRNAANPPNLAPVELADLKHAQGFKAGLVVLVLVGNPVKPLRVDFSRGYLNQLADTGRQHILSDRPLTLKQFTERIVQVCIG